MTTPTLRVARPADRPVMERLWLMFRHDMSEFQGEPPNADGTFCNERLLAALEGDPDWRPYLFSVDDRPVGLALVRALTTPTRVLNSFFVVRGMRRSGIGLRAVHDVLNQHPGPWEVAFQDVNATAVRFWRRVATEISGTAWTEERRPVPGKRDLPPDVWISFNNLGDARSIV